MTGVGAKPGKARWRGRWLAWALGQIGGCALVGLAMSVAISWSCAMFLRYDNTRSELVGTPVGARYEWVVVDPALGSQRVYFAGMSDDNPDISVMDRVETNGWWRRTGVFVKTPEARQEAYGWPMLCLYWWGQYDEGAHELHAHGGINVTPKARAAEQAYVVLPWLVLWRGLAVDSVVFGAAFFLAVPGFRAARRWRRVRRGRCPMCGHDVLGRFEEGCGECGWGGGSR